MEIPVLSPEAVELKGLDSKAAIQQLSEEQPVILGMLISEYMRLPQMAVITYHLLKSVMPDMVTISKETAEAVNSIIATDKDKLGEEFKKEQPNLGKRIFERYEYIPKPCLLLYFGLKQQVEANEMHGSNLFKVATEEEKQLKYLVSQVYHSLPSNKDWLDPVLEAQMKDIADSTK